MSYFFFPTGLYLPYPSCIAARVIMLFFKSDQNAVMKLNENRPNHIPLTSVSYMNNAEGLTHILRIAGAIQLLSELVALFN